MNIRLAHSGCIGILVAIALAMLWHGPIPQLPDYHAFADRRTVSGIPNAADVLSNLAFLLAGAWGLASRAVRSGAAGDSYAAFCITLLLTACGSTWYHLAPDDGRLVWDRLPIALACATLLLATVDDTLGRLREWQRALVVVLAVASVLWWAWTARHGAGDLRPYLALQALPLLVPPLLQWSYRRPRRERLAFAVAIGGYVLAKCCELLDDPILQLTGTVSGHTLKHLFAAGAAAVIIAVRHRDGRAAGSMPAA